MLRSTLKSLAARKLRLVMSAMAIVLGVGFVTGSLIFTDTLGRTFDGIVEGTWVMSSSGPREPTSTPAP